MARPRLVSSEWSTGRQLLNNRKLCWCPTRAVRGFSRWTCVIRTLFSTVKVTELELWSLIIVAWSLESHSGTDITWTVSDIRHDICHCSFREAFHGCRDSTGLWQQSCSIKIAQTTHTIEPLIFEEALLAQPCDRNSWISIPSRRCHKNWVSRVVTKLWKINVR